MRQCLPFLQWKHTKKPSEPIRTFTGKSQPSTWNAGPFTKVKSPSDLQLWSTLVLTLRASPIWSFLTGARCVQRWRNPQSSRQGGKHFRPERRSGHSVLIRIVRRRSPTTRIPRRVTTSMLSGNKWRQRMSIELLGELNKVKRGPRDKGDEGIAISD
jgi:hypothetical protein